MAKSLSYKEPGAPGFKMYQRFLFCLVSGLMFLVLGTVFGLLSDSSGQDYAKKVRMVESGQAHEVLLKVRSKRIYQNMASSNNAPDYEVSLADDSGVEASRQLPFQAWERMTEGQNFPYRAYVVDGAVFIPELDEPPTPFTAFLYGAILGVPLLLLSPLFLQLAKRKT